MRVTTPIVFFLILAGLASPLLAQTGPELLLKPFPKELGLDMDVSGYMSDTAHSKESGESIRIGIVETEGRARFRPGDIASPRLGFAFKYFDIDTEVQALPKQLYAQSIGFAMALGQYDGWILGVSGGIGYAGQHPFGDGNAFYGQANLLLFKELSKTSALAIGLDYDGNRTFKPDIPLPGFAYILRVRENLLLTFGLPVTGIQWEPFPDLRIELNYILTENYSARVGYTFFKGLEVYGQLSQRSDAFYFDNQKYGDDRLLFHQRQVEVGFTYRFRDAGLFDKDLELTIAGGYAFNGEFSVGFDNLNSRLIADVSDVPYLRFGLQLRF